MFSVTDRFSFDIAQGFLTHVCSNREDVRTPVIFLGNKCDLIHRRTISEKEASHIAASHSCQYLETSASENYTGVVHTFAELCRQIKVVNKKKEKLKKLMQKPSVAKKLQIRQSLRNFAERTWRSRTSTVWMWLKHAILVNINLKTSHPVPMGNSKKHTRRPMLFIAVCHNYSFQYYTCIIIDSCAL